MLHFYVQTIITGPELVITDKEQLHHLTVVLRARSGDAIRLFDRLGSVYTGTIGLIKKEAVTVRIESRRPVAPSKIELTVACAIPKASGMDEVVDSLTQLGVNTIIPMLTARVVAKPDDQEKKLERWRKIALNAAEQSQRSSMPEIPAVWDLSEVIRQTAGCHLKLVPTLESPTLALNVFLRDFREGRIVVLIGPEGDFAVGEVKQALAAGFKAATLGNNVLRVATAAAAVAAFIRFSHPEELP
jgi:16S rRNA (uracil1498-N3)-methyltransferase